MPDLLAIAPGEGEGEDGWELTDTRVVSLTFELSKHQMMDLLPEGLIRPVPPYAKVIIVDAPDSPAGPYREAGLFLGTRDRVQIRNVLLDAIVQGDKQLASGRRCFGGSRRAGSIELDVSDDEIRAVISGEEGELCRIRMGALRRCDATMLKFDALLVAGEEDGAPGLLRYGVRIPLADVEGTLSRDWEVTMARGAGVWRQLRPAFNVTAFATLGDARLEFPRVPKAPAAR
ncbi:MAG: acetoacetate decarboxylase family protein [Chloroflexi bacterium]|nr:acetoacetate decarboxylase family protein [Chloroflexota bacterium]